MDRVSVVLRVRPLNEQEREAGTFDGWRVDNQNTILRVDENGKPTGTGLYSFDHIYDGESKTQELYDTSARDVVQSCIEGYNATIFAYGQTGSGKTHTILGSDSEPGINKLAVRDLFGMMKNYPGRQFHVRVSYLEIYNEKIRDLLVHNSGYLQIQNDIKGNVSVTGLHEETVTTEEQVFKLMKDGEVRRSYGQTFMNHVSSRSHTIFRLVIESEDTIAATEDRTSTESIGRAVKVSWLNLVDLAGSEKIRDTGAEGLRKKEAGNINTSLLNLSRVIKAITDNVTHVPYRDSKLTFILKPSLGGNARTLIICNMTPAASFYDDTSGTLSFAANAKKMVNKPQVNETLDADARLHKINTEARLLKKKMAALEAENAELKLNGNGAGVGAAAAGDSARCHELEDELSQVKARFDAFRSQIVSFEANTSTAPAPRKRPLRRETVASGADIARFNASQGRPRQSISEVKINFIDKENLMPLMASRAADKQANERRVAELEAIIAEREHEIDNLNVHLAEFQTYASNLQQDLTTMNEDLESAHNEAEVITKDLADTIADSEILQQRNDELKRDKEVLEAHLAAVTAHMQDSEAAASSGELELARTELEAAKGELRDKEELVEALNQENREFEEQLNGAQATIHEQQAMLTALEEELVAFRARQDELEAAGDKDVRVVQLAEAQQRAAEARAAAAEQACAKLEATVRETALELAGHKAKAAEFAEAEAKLQKLEWDALEFASKTRELTAARDAAEHRAAELVVSVAALQDELAAVRVNAASSASSSAELAQLSAQLQSAQQNADAFTARATAAEEHIEGLMAELQVKTDAVASLEESAAQTSAKLQTLEEQLFTAEEAAVNADSARQEAEARLEKLVVEGVQSDAAERQVLREMIDARDGELASLRGALEAEEGRIGRLNDDLAAALNAAEAAKRELKTMKNKPAQAETAIQVLEKDALKSKEKIAELENKIKDQKQTKITLEADLRAAQTEARKAQAEVVKLEKEVEKLNQRAERDSAAKREATGAQSSLERDLAAATKECDQLTGKLAKAESDLVEATNEVEHLTEKLVQAEADFEALKERAEAEHQAMEMRAAEVTTLCVEVQRMRGVEAELTTALAASTEHAQAVEGRLVAMETRCIAAVEEAAAAKDYAVEANAEASRTSTERDEFWQNQLGQLVEEERTRNETEILELKAALSSARSEAFAARNAILEIEERRGPAVPVAAPTAVVGEELVSELTELHLARANAEAEKAELQTELETVRLEKQVLEDALAAASEVEATAAITQEKLIAAEAQLTAVQSTVQALESQLADVRVELVSACAERDELAAEVVRLNNEAPAAAADPAMQEQLTAAQNRLAMGEKMYKNLQERLTEATAALEEMNAAREEAEAQVDKLTEELSTAQASPAAPVAGDSLELSSARLEAAELRTRVAGLVTALEQSQLKQMAASSAELTEARHTIASLEAKIGTLNFEIEELGAALASATATADEVTAQLMAVQQQASATQQQSVPTAIHEHALAKLAAAEVQAASSHAQLTEKESTVKGLAQKIALLSDQLADTRLALDVARMESAQASEHAAAAAAETRSQLERTQEALTAATSTRAIAEERVASLSSQIAHKDATLVSLAERMEAAESQSNANKCTAEIASKQLQDTRAYVTELEGQLSEAATALEESHAVRGELAARTAEVGRLGGELMAVRSELNLTQSAIVDISSARTALSETVAERDREVTDLKGKLTELAKTKPGNVSRIRTLEAALSQEQSEKEEIQRKMQALERRFLEEGRSLEAIGADAIISNPLGSASAPAAVVALQETVGAQQEELKHLRQELRTKELIKANETTKLRAAESKQHRLEQLNQRLTQELELARAGVAGTTATVTSTETAAPTPVAPAAQATVATAVPTAAAVQPVVSTAPVAAAPATSTGPTTRNKVGRTRVVGVPLKKPAEENAETCNQQ